MVFFKEILHKTFSLLLRKWTRYKCQYFSFLPKESLHIHCYDWDQFCNWGFAVANPQTHLSIAALLDSAAAPGISSLGHGSLESSQYKLGYQGFCLRQVRCVLSPATTFLRYKKNWRCIFAWRKCDLGKGGVWIKNLLPALRSSRWWADNKCAEIIKSVLIWHKGTIDTSFFKDINQLWKFETAWNPN